MGFVCEKDGMLEDNHYYINFNGRITCVECLLKALKKWKSIDENTKNKDFEQWFWENFTPSYSY
ncbi:MAG: hypothetical protein ACOCP8_02690 [archaeon]